MLTSEKTFQQERYRLVHQFAQDENSAVYEAYDDVLKTSVVLKAISSAARDSKYNLKLADEAGLLTDLKHDHLLSFHDYFSEAGNHYLVMELPDGNNLVEAIEKNKKPFSFLEVAKWADQLLDALSYLHKQTPPVIHQRIAPQNVILSQTGKVKLKITGDDKMPDTVSGRKFTSSANSDLEAAYFNYLPLEQIWEGLDPASQKVILNSYDDRSIKILENPADARSDIYALGATLYYLITGQPPVDSLARSIDLLEGKSDPLLAPHKLNSSIPQEVSNVLLRAMEIKRENRFDSAVVMRQILRTAFVKTNAVETIKAGQQQEEPVVSQKTESAGQAQFEQERRAIEQNRLKIKEEQKRLEEERQIIERRNLELEVARKQQMELAGEQLRQAENRRLQAELRAAEAERRLLEKEKEFVDDELFELDDAEILDRNSARSAPPVSKNLRETAQTISPVQKADEIKALPNLVAEEVANRQSEAPEEVFAAPEKSSQSFKRLAAAAVVLAAFSGAGWGIWNFSMSKPAADNAPPASRQEVLNNTSVPQSSPETAPALAPETTAQTSSQEAASASSPETTATADSPAPKNKFAASQPVKKQIPQTAKPAASQKKAVTVDDIINDN